MHPMQTTSGAHPHRPLLSGQVALLFCTLEPDGNDAARIVAELGIDPSAVWISVAPTMGTRFVQAVGPRAAEYAFAPLQWHASLAFTDPIFGHSEAFVTNFTATYGFKPDYTVSSGAAAGIALQLAIESADSLEVGAVAQALRELRTETFFGEIAFNRYQRNYGGTTATIQILNGNSFAVMPESGAQMFPELPPSRAERAACPEAVFLNNFTQCRARIGDMRVTGIVVPVVATMLLLAIVGGVGCWRHKRDNSRAPRGTGVPFGVMFTDIQSSTALWACVAADMARALDTHHAHIRLLIRRHKCYEVKTIGPSHCHPSLNLTMLCCICVFVCVEICVMLMLMLILCCVVLCCVVLCCVVLCCVVLCCVVLCCVVLCWRSC